VGQLGENESLGAWALLEAEPRVVSARAAEESLLLRVDREDFYDLLLDYPELGQGILKALVRRMRKLVGGAAKPPAS
jgi:CRP-like cAMP-binding protein